LCINFDKKMVGRHFGRLLHELTWSPCFWCTLSLFSLSESDLLKSSLEHKSGTPTLFTFNIFPYRSDPINIRTFVKFHLLVKLFCKLYLPVLSKGTGHLFPYKTKISMFLSRRLSDAFKLLFCKLSCN
jgi:hypothetical protein